MKKKCTIFILMLLSFLNGIKFTHAQVAFQHDDCPCTPVTITTQPTSPLTQCVGSGTYSFTVNVSGTGPFTFRWQENSTDITEGGVYSGSNTATLTIANPPFTLNGKSYRCIVTNCLNNSIATNNNAMLTLEAMPTDINTDGITNSSDFALLLHFFNNGCNDCREDINRDGIVNVADFLRLVGQYNNTCN